MKAAAPGSFASHLKTLRELAGFTQEELATIAGLSVHAVSALERGERRRPHPETLRALAAALDLSQSARDALLSAARPPALHTAADTLAGSSLPAGLTPMLGRDADLQTLKRWLADPSARLITLTGPGGAGKTRLAVELARAVAAEGRAHAVFAPLAAVRDASFVPSAIAEALELADVDAAALPMRVSGACAERPTLLVLDNFEQVLDASPLVVALLASASTLRILTTSRAPLRVRGEREYIVGPLALPLESDEHSPSVLARSPAVRLFVERVRDLHPGFRLTGDNGATVAAICRRLDGLPLAVELAAPWMKVLTADDLLRRLRHDVLLSAAGPRDLPERQQTINATLAWSYQLLDDSDQRAFRRLGALPGRFHLGAATALLAPHGGADACGQTLKAVAGLIDRSLLLRAENSVRNRPAFEMLETVRAYAALELAASGEREDALNALARYCGREAALAGEGLVGPSQLEWLNRIREDLDLHRMALSWLVEHGRADDAAGIASHLVFFWVIRGHATEGLRWHEQIQEMSSLSRAAAARLLVSSGMLQYSLGEVRAARAALARAQSLAETDGDRSVAVQADTFLGHVEHAVGNEARARDLFSRSMEGFRALSIPWGAGIALGGLAWVALATGDLNRAELLLDESAVALQHAGPWFLLLTLYLRAVLAVRRGDPDQAIRLARQSLTRIRDLHDRFAFVYALVPLAAAAVLKGNDSWAARILGARDAVAERTGATVVDRSVLDLREQVERQAMARLGPARWASAHAAGRETSIDSLLKDIERGVGTVAAST